ncbi:glutamate-1-semialdehyde aminotransferase (aminomutase) [Candidatus Sulfotelmatobacter kueseliae]|uniref:Glutamate-1-semialdehyde 2,1-aminomutase n=1 Tax=Candidatus Sulfotelmatobacter kueseliae TaxID=2042962 RepID=A0A2U3KJJ2_9BACT|nr:glutamate-1-semialdehyde aminotransferase (aminomutase) [Candidatus Sulfotelmatobacter kueseliae]
MPSITSRKTEQSRRLQERAARMIPGGVNSPVRAFGSVGAEPLFIVRGKGSHVWDADENEYIDYIGSWGPLILGHAEPGVLDAILGAACNGTSFGASTPSEADLAELVLSAFPHMQKVRFVSSGTEATMSAIRLARAYTKRKFIVKFEGCYHGHADCLLVKAGSGVATLGIPGSAGVPEEFTQFTLALPFNNLGAVEHAFHKFKHEIACVIVEPVVGNMGCVPAADDYLVGLRLITERERSVLIFDEVMTGFRVAYGGAQELYNILPDLTTMGKIIGGGLPVGAYGGSSEIMDLVAPLGPMYQAGTLSGNPLAMAAGCATLKQLRDRKSEIYPRLDKLSGELVHGVAAAAQEAGIRLCHNRVGSMFTWFFTPGPVRDWDSASKSNTDMFGRFFRAMLDHGVYLPPSQYEAAFLGATHTAEDVQKTITAAKEAFAALRA